MAQFNLNDTVAVLMRILNNHQDIIRLWHEVSDLLQRLGLVSASAVPQRASHPFDVNWLQIALNKQTGSKLKVDGVFGPQTVLAVHTYQGMRNLAQDGWPGPLTLAALERDMQGP